MRVETLVAVVRRLFDRLQAEGIRRINYKLHPANIAIIGGGLLYFILPADLILDFIPLVGYLDDLAVLTTIMASLKGEIDKYRSWKETNPAENSNKP